MIFEPWPNMPDNKGPCGEYCAVVDECQARGAEIERLRAELAAANARIENAERVASVFFETEARLHAELAAAQQQAEDAQQAVQVYCDDHNKARAELAAARELLEEAAELLPVQFDDELDDLHARIVAALAADGKG